MTKEAKKSNEEIWFEWWCEELMDKNFIKSYTAQPDTFILSNPVQSMYMKKLKTKEETKVQTLLNGHEYTPDYRIVFNRKAHLIFYDRLRNNDMIKCETEILTQGPTDGDQIAYIETKADFDFNNMTRAATINIKYTYDKLNIFVNLIKLPKLFENTFCPKRYIEQQVYQKNTKNNKIGDSKIKFKVKTLNQFVDEQIRRIENTLPKPNLFT